MHSIQIELADFDANITILSRASASFWAFFWHSLDAVPHSELLGFLLKLCVENVQAAEGFCKKNGVILEDLVVKVDGE